MDFNEVRDLLQSERERRAGLESELAGVRERLEVGEDSDGLRERAENLSRGIDNSSGRIEQLVEEERTLQRQRIARRAQDPRNVERELTEADRRGWSRETGRDPRQRADLDGGLRALERCSDLLPREHGERLEQLVREKDPTGQASRYLSSHGEEAYASAFAKLLRDPTQGHLRFTPAEVEAVRRAGAVEQERAMGDFTGSAGGFGLPIAIDPSIVLVSAGVLNPLRQLARVESINTLIWRGVDSDGVVAAFGAEAAAASDNSPVLRQPTVTVQRANVFVPFSVEVGQDYPGLLNELGVLIADAKNVLEASAFLTGTGTNQPVGLLAVGTSGALTTTQRTLTAGVATVAYGDIWLAKQSVPARFLADSTWVAHPTTLDSVYQLSPAGSTTLALQMPEGRGGPLVGMPTEQLSTVATGSVTGTKIAVVGNWKNGFRIVDRIGLQVELVPTLFGAAQGQFPTGQRGVFAWWRTGCTAIGTGSAAGCALRYLEVK